MILALVVALAASSSAPEPELVGVVRDGRAVSRSGLLRAGDRLRTGETGWAEVHVLGRGRVRLFAGTAIQLRAGPALRMVSGRIWLDVHVETPLVLRGGEGVVAAGSSVILEDTSTGGLVVAARTGRVRVGSVEVAAGQVWRRPLLAAASAPRRGGDELADLLRRQLEQLAGDPAGLEVWLREVLTRAPVGAPTGLSPGGIVRAEQEAAGGTADVLTESALRPPPFFEEEVPSRGPNVQVEVDFSED